MRTFSFVLPAVGMAFLFASCHEQPAPASHQPALDTASYVILPYNSRARLGMDESFGNARPDTLTPTEVDDLEQLIDSAYRAYTKDSAVYLHDLLPLDRYLRQYVAVVDSNGERETCDTDTFRNYALVSIQGQGVVGIDRNERILYHVFMFDNGPDEAVDHLFRIVVDRKIGYADVVTGKIVIQPRFACAWPFEKGRAKVAFDCQTRRDGEYHTWFSSHWFYINKKGRRL